MPRTAVPLSSHRIVRTTSIEAAQSAMSTSLAPHRLVPTGGSDAFCAQHNGVDLDGVGLHFLDYGVGASVVVEAMDFHLVQIPLAGRTVVDAGSRPADAGPGAAVVTPAGQAVRMTYSPGNPRVVVQVARRMLADRTAVARERGLDVPTTGGAALDLTRGAGRSWRGLVDLVLGDLERPGGLLEGPVAAASLRLALVDGLVAGLAAGTVGGPPTTSSAAVVRRAAQLLDDHCGEPLGTPDVAEALQVSVRSLQSGFREHLATTPMAYLRRARLERIRAALQDGTAGTVTEAAGRWAYPHLGRLAVDYRAAYGESPAQTLRRSR